MPRNLYVFFSFLFLFWEDTMGLHLHCIGVLSGWDGEPERFDSLGWDAKRVHGFLTDVEVEHGDEDEDDG